MSFFDKISCSSCDPGIIEFGIPSYKNPRIYLEGSGYLILDFRCRIENRVSRIQYRVSFKAIANPLSWNTGIDQFIPIL